MAYHANGQHLYSEEEDAWIRENLDRYTYPELTRLFNERYGTSVKSISDHIIKTMGLNKTINTGNCRKGERRCTNMLSVGTTRFDGQNMYIKIADNVNDCKNRKMPLKHEDPNWMRLDYKVWQDHGLTPPQNFNEMLIHLNTDKQDCCFENLYMTSRAINLLMAKNGWYSTDREVTLAGLKWCELFYAMKEATSVRICRYCGREFKAKHKTHAYCCKSCGAKDSMRRRRWLDGQSSNDA